jgi:Mg-chelatase subunit ChlD
MRTWAFWRRVQYGAGFFAILFLVFGSLYALYLYSPSNCLDQKENGSEDGVDCGGRCARICVFDVAQPYVLWVQSFRATDGMYNAVAYVENRNVNAGSPGVGYTIRLYDRDGLIVERKGETELPPNTLYPVFEGRIETGDRTPTETTIEFDEDQVWVNAVLGGEQFALVRRELTGADDRPVLSATLKNESLDEALDVDVVATIFNKEGTALTSSRTKVPIFSGRSNRDITFTWQEPIAKTLRSCEVPSDIVVAIDLSGSMNDDGGTPPQPVTAVLESARDFARRLSDVDQIGLVTYATDAETVEVLTDDRTTVADTIDALVIDPASERGSTNTGEAIRHAREELSSSRHNSDARKVLILLTDGLATAPEDDPEGYARTQADLLKETGTELFTIGLGAKLNETFLTEIATDPKHYFKAPSITTLGRIYEDITGAICEEGAAVIEIIPKQSAVYDPLVP